MRESVFAQFFNRLWSIHFPAMRKMVCDVLRLAGYALFGIGLEENKKGQPGHGTTAALVGLVLASTGTLIAAVQGTDTIFVGFVWFYFVATLIPLWAMNVICRSAEPGQRKNRHWFDSPTVRIAQFALVFCIVLWVSSWVGGFGNLLPGQATGRFTTLKIDAVNDYDQWPDGSKGLVARSNIDESMERFLLTVTVEETLRNTWDVWYIVLREGTASKPGRGVQAKETDQEATDFFVHSKLFRNFREPGKKYCVEVGLHTTGTLTEDEWNALKRTIKDGKGISIVEKGSL